MEAKWKKYYSEIFRTYQSEFFRKMWGDHIDEWGEEYEEVYIHELSEMRDDFANFMYLFNKYNIDYSRDAITLQLLYLFGGLSDTSNVQGAYDMADMIIHSIIKRIGFNDVWHPEGRPL